MSIKDIRHRLDSRKKEMIANMAAPMPIKTPPAQRAPEKVIYHRGAAPILIGRLSELSSSERVDFLR